VHADMHTISFNPNNADQFIIGTDGGVFRTDNASNIYPTFISLNRNYNVTQTYGVAAKQTGEVIMGCQDNGTQYIDFTGNSTKAAREIQGGDGFNVSIAWSNESAMYEEYYSGQLTRSSNNGAAFNAFFDTRIDANGDGAPEEGADWNAPFTLWEANDASFSFFALGCGISAGHVWVTLGALNFATNPDWFRMPPTDGPVTCTAFSSDGDNLFVGTSKGTVYRYSGLLQAHALDKFRYAAINSTAQSWIATDSGITVSSVNVGASRYLRSIAVDPHNSAHVVVTGARYGLAAYVWRSTNAVDSTMTFTDITGDLPKMPVWSSCIDYVNPDLILIGTDLGVFARDMSVGGWVEQNQGMDRVPVLQIIQVPYYGQTTYTYLGTYGRGVFHTASLVGIGKVDNDIVNGLSVFPSPVSDVATVKFTLQHAGDLVIRVFDLNGKEVLTKQELKQTSGIHSYTIGLNNLMLGTYIVNVTSGSSSNSQKIVVMR